MLFSRSYSISTNKSVDNIKSILIGKHFKVHNMEFEIYERDKFIKIIPHAEQIRDIKTLPITHMELEGKGDSTQVKVSYKIRKLDQGGPYLIVIFCLFMLAGAIAFYYAHETNLMYLFAGLFVVIFGAFWLKMQSGYFDYAHKIRSYVKEHLAAA